LIELRPRNKIYPENPKKPKFINYSPQFTTELHYRIETFLSQGGFHLNSSYFDNDLGIVRRSFRAPKTWQSKSYDLSIKCVNLLMKYLTGKDIEIRLFYDVIDRGKANSAATMTEKF
jgi:hypothetical protein